MDCWYRAGRGPLPLTFVGGSGDRAVLPPESGSWPASPWQRQWQWVSLSAPSWGRRMPSVPGPLSGLAGVGVAASGAGVESEQPARATRMTRVAVRSIPCTRRSFLSGIRDTRPVPRAASPLPPRTLANGTKAPNPFKVRLVNLQLSGLLRSARTRQWKAAKPGSKSRATDVFCGWFRAGAQRAGRQAAGPAVSPRPRVPRTERALSNLAPAAASNPFTNARPTEMPMKQSDPEEHGAGGPGPHDPRTSGPGCSPGLTF